MKPVHLLATACTLILLLFSCGCTGGQKVSEATPAPATLLPATAVTPVVTENPYPNASALKVKIPFGTREMTGTAAVTKYYIRPEYSWTSPSWRSAREQAAYAPGNEPQTGFNTEKPAAGNTFLFVFYKFSADGSQPVYVPSPNQFVVSAGGTTYQYRPVSDSGVVIEGITGTQYDYLVGKGGTGGYVQPGASNDVEGYLIYEIPSDLSPDQIYVVANLDYQNRGEWRLA